jgi:Holliday junction resolvase RusA-like endonuclease
MSGAADLFEFSLDLPVPPSVNRLRKIDPVGRRLREQFYRDADKYLLVARGRTREPLPVRKVTGQFEATILLNEKMTRMDADNAIKIVLDYAVSREFVTDDRPRFMRRLIVEWGCPSIGCRLTIRGAVEAAEKAPR